MNEKIKELIEQAGIESYPAKLLVNTDEEGKVSSKWEIPLEKFAELIVRECLSIVDDAERGGSNEVWDNAVKFIRKDLKEHFGVE